MVVMNMSLSLKLHDFFKHKIAGDEISRNKLHASVEKLKEELNK